MSAYSGTLQSNKWPLKNLRDPQKMTFKDVLLTKGSSDNETGLLLAAASF